MYVMQAFFSTSPKKLKDEKTQNSRKKTQSTKFKVSANLVRINAEKQLHDIVGLPSILCFHCDVSDVLSSRLVW